MPFKATVHLTQGQLQYKETFSQQYYNNITFINEFCANTVHGMFNYNTYIHKNIVANR